MERNSLSVTTGPKASKARGLKKNFLWTKKKIKESVEASPKKNVIRKRITETVCSGSSFKTTKPNPIKKIIASNKIVIKNLGTGTR